MGKKKFEILLSGWLAQNLSPSEIDEFLNALHKPEFQELLGNRFENDLKTNAFSGLSSARQTEIALMRLVQERKKDKDFATKTVLTLTKYRIAAVVLICLSTAALLFFSKSLSNRTKTRITTLPVREYKHKAKLVLANGDSIALEDLANKKNSLFSISSEGIIYNARGIPVETHSIHNPAGSRPVKIILSDETSVMLNSASALTFQTRFSKEKREIKLVGEAYFDVAENKQKPFIIHTGKMDVRVLGTAFNVKSYPNDPAAQTTLFRGSVEVVARKQPDRKIVLRPNEKLVIVENTNTTDKERSVANKDLFEISHIAANPPSKNEVSDEILWTKNKLSFDYMELREIVPMIERWYDVKIRVKNKALLAKRFSGNFEENSVEDVLKALQLVGNFSYTKNGNLITIN
ncbi:MAG: FecR family protein [Niabella sp.]